MNVFFHIHYFFLSMLLLNMKQILGWTPVSLMFAVSVLHTGRRCESAL